MGKEGAGWGKRGLDGEGGGWMGKEGAGLAPTEAAANPLFFYRRSKPRSMKPGSGRASREASRWRKPRYASRRRLSPLLPVSRPGCPDRGAGGLFALAGGCVADSAAGGEPPGHLQAEGEVGASRGGDGVPARYGTGRSARSGAGSASRFPPASPDGFGVGALPVRPC